MKSMCGLVFVILLAATVASASIQGRIHAGTPVIDVVPFHAHLRFFNTLLPDNVYDGSGSLISNIHVLTTAVNIRGFNQWSAGFGSVERDSLVFFEATGAIVHENYDATSGVNNIGIIFFGAGIHSDVVTITPIALPLLNEQIPSEGEVGNFVSFGLTGPGGVTSPNLLQSTQQVFGQASCANLFPEQEFINQFCAIDFVNFTTPCGGEQGSGFVQQIRNQPVLVGLVAYVWGTCNLVTSITFYTRVTDFRFWLLVTVGV